MRLFISFEGLEGSGKSTQVSLLSGKLREKRYALEVVREPGGTRIGEHIRTITHNRENVDLTAVSECYLMAASRAQLVREIIKPSLAAKKIVIADRFIDSSLAYQGYGRQIGEEEVLSLNKLALDGVFPDLTFFLDVSYLVGHKRKESGPLDRLDLQQEEFYQRVHAGYKSLAKHFSARIIYIDGNKSMDEISQNIWSYLEKRLS